MQEKNTQQCEFGDNLKVLLKRKGWKQKDLADKIGVTAVSVNRWIKGVNGISVDYIASIANALCVPIEELTGKGPEMQKLTQYTSCDEEPSAEEWKRRALEAEAKLRHLQQACDALGQHVEGLASTVRHFSSIITE